MKCLNCGANIDNNSIECPYCKNKIIDSIRTRKVEDIKLVNRYAEIDKLFGIELKEDFYKYNIQELEKYYESLENEYDYIGNQLRVEESKSLVKIQLVAYYY